MPFYRFFVHGTDEHVPNGERGFFATRRAFASDEPTAAAKVLSRLRREFTDGASAAIWNSGPPTMVIEKARRIGWRELWSAPNRGGTFYDEREESESARHPRRGD
jgi:hypothetical protein